MALRTLCGIAENGANDSARVAAAIHILDRGWGKPPTTHTAPDGEGEIRVVIRHIVGGRDVPAPRDAQVVDQPSRQLQLLHSGEDDGP